jgi:hypothetical protein
MIGGSVLRGTAPREPCMCPSPRFAVYSFALVSARFWSTAIATRGASTFALRMADGDI